MINWSFLSKTVITAAIMVLLSTSTVLADTKAITIGDNINIRENNSTDSTIVTTMKKGETLDVLENCDGWLKVGLSSGTQAFVSSQWVKITKTDGVVNALDVNVRSAASTSSEVVDVFGNDKAVTILGREGDFYVIDYYGAKAYIHIDFVDSAYMDKLDSDRKASSSASVQSTYGVVVSSDGLRIRQSSSTASSVLEVMPYGEFFDVLGNAGEWLNVKGPSGSVGYVMSEFTELRQGTKPSRAQISSKGQQVIAYGKQFLGTRYVWGGTNLKKGVDCSGFVQSVFKNFGISLNRSSSSQASNGTKVSKANLTAGDLVFFDTNGGNNSSISHVGIYIGNGDFIHASSSSRTRCVTISNIYDSFYSKAYVTARRVIK